MPNAGSTENFIRSYDFFRSHEEANEPFTFDELCQAVGWKASVPDTYRSKKWKPFLTKSGKTYLAKGFGDLSRDEFVRMMSQNDRLSNDPRKPELDIDVERLVTKAREAALNALDGYNRATTVFRTESFIVMMVIAWRTLLHAVFQKQGVDYFHRAADGSPKLVDGEEKAWELKKCSKEYFNTTTHPIAVNLDFMIGLRNLIEHRYAPAIDPRVAGECQAMLLNFDEVMIAEFGEYYAIRESLAVALQTARMRPAAQTDAMRKFQGNQYEDLVEYIDAFRAELPDEVYEDMRYSFRVYLVPKMGNHISSSDIAFEFIKYDPEDPSATAALRKMAGVIRDRLVQVVNAGAFKPSQVVKNVAEKSEKPFKMHNHTSAWKMYGVRKAGLNAEGCKPEFCQFDQVHGDYVYTQRWIDFLVKKISSEEEYRRLLNYKEARS